MFGHKSLSKEEAKQVLLNISDGRYNDSQLSAFMTVFLMRSITTEELAGFREAILERRVVVDLDCHDAIDIVGTGGDGKNTFNISTAACFVVGRSRLPGCKTRKLRCQFGEWGFECTGTTWGEIYRTLRSVTAIAGRKRGRLFACTVFLALP